MNNSDSIRHIFPGSNTPSGFHSFFSYILPQQEAYKIYSIKGGPGTGKSSFMKKIGEYAISQGYLVEYHHCSSDPNSLDCVMIPKLKVAILDGTSPHIVDPMTPGAIDSILNFGAFWDEKQLKENRKEISELFTGYGNMFKKAYHYLSAAYNIYESILFTEGQYVNQDAKQSLENEIFENLFSSKPISSPQYKERHFFGTAITCNGLMNYIHTTIGSSKNIYFIKESFGCHSKQLMNRILNFARNYSLSIECYHSPLDPEKIEDIILPDLDIVITVSHPYHKVNVLPTHIYDLTTHLNKNQMLSEGAFLDKDRSILQDLLDKGIGFIAEAKKRHDLLEKYYIDAVDFKQIDDLAKKLIIELFS